MYRNKFTGCLLGSAIGDALGMQTEGMKPDEIKMKFNVVFDYGKGSPGSNNEKLKPGQYTDDTEQTIILARSIIAAGKFDAEEFSKRLLEHYQIIMRLPELNRGWGATSLTACRHLADGKGWKESGEDSPTCGSAIRASPIGLLYPGKPDKTEETARTSSLPTHTNPESIAGAVAVAAAISLAVTNTDPDVTIKTSSDLARKYSIKMADKIQAVEKVRHIPDIKAFSILGTSIMATDVVPCAMYCFARNPLDFPKTLITAINAGGDTDSIACIAGAISGAYLGVDAIPKKWLARLENRDEIESIALELWEIAKHNIQYDV
ncbi:MAG: ADP-ribosylglycohydrolase family protein [Methanosarcinales archaeon]|nr:ADP-ribosylglycohydrolase family protein [Methanosarcinales archaeon]